MVTFSVDTFSGARLILLTTYIVLSHAIRDELSSKSSRSSISSSSSTNERDPVVITTRYVDNVTLENMQNNFKGLIRNWFLVGEKDWLLPDRYLINSDYYVNFVPRSRDTWVISYPRSGATWIQEMVWLLRNELNFGAAKSIPLRIRFPFLEEAMVMNESEYKVSKLTHSPRFIMSHFSLSLLPNILQSKAKIIYIARNPKDVAVSYYYYYQSLKTYSFTGSFHDFWYYFKYDLTTYSSYWEHVKEGWARKDEPNFLFLFYEELSRDLLSVIRRVSTFLGTPYSENQHQQLADHLQFYKMKKNPMINISKGHYRKKFKKDNFIRNGQSGSWVSKFTDGLNMDANQWITHNLRGTDLKFPHVNLYFLSYYNRWNRKQCLTYSYEPSCNLIECVKVLVKKWKCKS